MSKEKFNKWNKVKINIDKKERKRFYINTREVWNINLGKNVGYESFGKGDFFTRPVLVIKIVGSVVFVATMTTVGKENNKFYFKLDNKYFGKDSYITLFQVRILDKKRFIERIGKIDTKDFIEIKNSLKQILF